MTPTAASENDSHIYDTRLRGRLQSIDKKYDDIFSAVFKKASSCVILDEIATIRRKGRVKSSSISFDTRNRFPAYARFRSASDCDSAAASDISRDTDSSGSQSPEIFVEETIIEDEPPSVDQLSLTAQDLKYNCGCGNGFKRHSDLHEHLYSQHYSSNSQCSRCRITVKGIRNNYVCRICHKFVHSSMDDHLRGHYQDRKGTNAFMECRSCYRSFRTISEVREHERRSHYGMRQKPQGNWPCDYCHKEFTSRHNRDVHLVTHVNTAVGGIWENIAQMQELLTDQTLVNQCPICDSVMGSRKSFRLHVIHKHLLRDPNHFITSMGLPTASQVLAAMRSGVKKEIKQEVKQEEPEGHEEVRKYPVQVKTEPIDE